MIPHKIIDNHFKAMWAMYDDYSRIRQLTVYKPEYFYIIISHIKLLREVKD